MTRERSLWQSLRDALPVSAQVDRIENRVSLGTPDVHLAIPGKYGWLGWIELKSHEPPKKAQTIYKIPHFTQEQRQWLVDHLQTGGNAYMLIRGGGELLWLRGDVAAVWVGYCTWADLHKHAQWVGTRCDDFVCWLLRHRK